MRPSEIRYRLRQDFQLAVLSWMGSVALLVITPFFVYRSARGDWVIAAMEGALMAAILATVLYAWLTGDTRRSCLLFMYFDFLLGILAVRLVGQIALPWMYPMLVANFFLVHRHHVIIVSVIYLALLLVEGSAFPGRLAGFGFAATALLVCLYTYIFAYRSELQRQQLENLASRDTLTGAFNRRTFQQELLRAHQAFAREQTVYGLLVIDIDYFKRVNDTWGHDVGDEVLVRLARLVERSVRKTDRFFRFGGEEFVLLVYSTHPDALKAMANNICCQVEKELSYQGKTLTVSIGGALLRPTEGPDAWFARADAALYRAKHQGRNQAVIDG
ncbi:MAG TPA: GGDEF domain-containing protein [Candidatus Competibacter sp.]|nr:GGDEF domain-containing protein [Candidatus Competibacteraceae bacterium]HRC73650.1 GGDEF domain-containing protein [Candidatus Competibacter sp.]